MLRSGREFYEKPFEFIEQVAHGGIPASRDDLPVKTISGEQLLRTPAFVRNVEPCGVSARQFHKHHLGAIQVLAEIHQEHSFADLIGRCRCRRQHRIP